MKKHTLSLATQFSDECSVVRATYQIIVRFFGFDFHIAASGGAAGNAGTALATRAGGRRIRQPIDVVAVVLGIAEVLRRIVRFGVQQFNRHLAVDFVLETSTK